MEVVVSTVPQRRAQLLLTAQHRFLDPYLQRTQHRQCRGTHMMHTFGLVEMYLPFLQILLPNSFTTTTANPLSTRRLTLKIGRRTGSNSNIALTVIFTTVHINQLELNVHRTLRFNWRTGRRQKCSCLRWTRFHFARPRKACRPRINQQLGVTGLFTILTLFIEHHNPLKFIIRVRQAMHTTSTTGTRIVCLFLLRTYTCNVSNHITVVTSAILLGVAIHGFGALSLTFLDLTFLALAILVGLVPAVFRQVTFLRAHMTDSILREHTRTHRRWA